MTQRNNVDLIAAVTMKISYFYLLFVLIIASLHFISSFAHLLGFAEVVNVVHSALWKVLCAHQDFLYFWVAL